ncbi:CCAAT/enhancer-binding protein gamma-like isoform X1 [Tribolium madens]|uniref:CCAAT/enhancer-binding protein gamma-like isoform X1 n=2 Tax=Tribolium madens TaxID=41895 RepID=UPI001CF75648|nr:CCAAT/enhancer-binding protein gamma-like isoform X1 [Tribolium madens]
MTVSDCVSVACGFQMPPRKGRVKKEGPESGEDSDEYRKKRDRNNLAVKRSRVKSKQKTQETLNRVTKLRNENTVLEEKVKTLTKELGFLKELFIAHAANNVDSGKFEGVDLQQLLGEETSSSSGENKQ